jgi:BCD family chlorophyll transporter-like MFS transporter
VAFGIGGFLGAAALDIARIFLSDIGPAFAIVFGVEGLLFICAALCAMWVGKSSADDTKLPMMPSAELLSAE